jgi:hypothetical protein
MSSRARILFLLLAVGCGGAPFESALLTADPAVGTTGDPTDGPTIDGGSEGASDAAMTMDAGPRRYDAGGGAQDAGASGDPDVGAPGDPDVGVGNSDTGDPTPPCTPFSELRPASQLCSGRYATPAYYAIVASSDGACWPQIPTPVACACKETYSCACLMAAKPCGADPRGSSTPVSCDDSPGTEVTVVCR